MGYQFLKAKKSVKYILMNDLIKMLQKAERDDSIMAKLEKLEDVDLLLIDEAFDKEKVTIYKSNFQVPFLDSFLRSRMQTKHKGIIFISNVSPYDIEAKGFNYSIQDLVVRNMNKEKGFMEFKDRYDSIKSTVDTNTLF
jgi:DNA replication protein DnaC